MLGVRGQWGGQKSVEPEGKARLLAPSLLMHSRQVAVQRNHSFSSPQTHLQCDRLLLLALHLQLRPLAGLQGVGGWVGARGRKKKVSSDEVRNAAGSWQQVR